MFTKQKAIILGASGLRMTVEEREFFALSRPLGFILFSRNIADKDQVKALVREMRDAVGNPYAPISIDQEGGRVSRFKAPIWYSAPPASVFGEIADQNLADASRALELNTTLIALDLIELGITCDTIPVLDVLGPDTHNVIGDRAYSADKSIVTALGEIVCQTLTKFGVAPVIKHIPGHGRAMADSHIELPVVSSSYEDLVEVDFYPFKKLNNAHLAMTAHVLYKAIDPDHPGTLSKKVISEIRNTIGFKNLLLTDCILMKALSGSLSMIAEKALEAGCDIILQSRGTVEEMDSVITKLPFITESQDKILIKAFGQGKRDHNADRRTIRAELNDLFMKYNIKGLDQNNLIDPTT